VCTRGAGDRVRSGLLIRWPTAARSCSRAWTTRSQRPVRLSHRPAGPARIGARHGSAGRATTGRSASRNRRSTPPRHGRPRRRQSRERQTDRTTPATNPTTRQGVTPTPHGTPIHSRDNSSTATTGSSHTEVRTARCSISTESPVWSRQPRFWNLRFACRLSAAARQPRHSEVRGISSFLAMLWEKRDSSPSGSE
jgi:hypothetical protein